MVTPSNICGIGLRHLHYHEIIASLPSIPLLEIHSENFFYYNLRVHRILETIAASYNLSFHSIGMSLGSTDDINIKYLKRLKELIDIYKPQFISDHLSWNDKDHLNLLQTKINRYLGFVESGELFENYPDAKGRSVCIRLAFKYELNSIAKDFVDYMKIALAKENIDFSYKLG